MTQCITSYQAKYFVHSLTRRLPANDGAKFTATLQDARMACDAYDTIWDAFLGIGTLIVRFV